jgi:hypothetical protein
LSGADMKAQKKARVDAELKDAISALKKPNRTLAVKDFVEAADKRASAGQLKSRLFFLNDFQAHANMHHRNEETQPRLACRTSEGDARQQPVQRRTRSRKGRVSKPSTRPAPFQRPSGAGIHPPPQVRR